MVMIGAMSSLSAEDVKTVTGKATFEKRSTIVPMTYCENQDCPTSQSYWVLMLDENGYKYELEQMFAVDVEAAPESLEVLGTVIRPGALVEIEARINSLTENYAMMSDVRQASLVNEITARNYPLWHCVTGLDEGQKIQAEVWKREGSYELRVIAHDDTIVGEVAQLNHVISRTEAERVFFNGEQGTAKAELRLDQGGRLLVNVPSFLEFSGLQVGGAAQLPIHFKGKLRCDRSTFRQVE